MQFDVFRNTHNRAAFPYVLVVQHDVLSALNTCVVVPLTARKKSGLPVSRLHPSFEISGEQFTMATQHIGALPAASLRAPVQNLSSRRAEIIGALDMLFTGF